MRENSILKIYFTLLELFKKTLYQYYRVVKKRSENASLLVIDAAIN